MQHCNPVATPCVKTSARVPAAPGVSEAKEMSLSDATPYRRAAARINYVALDRLDLGFASRVASSCMSNPKEGDELIIKRIIRYLKGKPRVAIRYQFQDESDGIVVYTTPTGPETHRLARAQAGGGCAVAITPSAGGANFNHTFHYPHVRRN